MEPRDQELEKRSGIVAIALMFLMVVGFSISWMIPFNPPLYVWGVFALFTTLAAWVGAKIAKNGKFPSWRQSSGWFFFGFLIAALYCNRAAYKSVPPIDPLSLSLIGIGIVLYCLERSGSSEYISKEGIRIPAVEPILEGFSKLMREGINACLPDKVLWVFIWIVEGLCFAVMAFFTYTQIVANKMDWTALLIAAYLGCLIRLALVKDPPKHRVMMLNFLIGATVLAAIARFGQPGLTFTNAFVYVLVSTVLMAPTVELRKRVEKTIGTQS